MPPPRIEITADCDSGTPSSFGPGAHATDLDGSIYRVEWATGHRTYKVARDREMVGRWREALVQARFDAIQFDHFGKPWCGITRRIESQQHSVRWPTAVGENGALEHRFQGVPPEVWFVFIEMIQVARNQEICTSAEKELFQPYELIGSVAARCRARASAKPGESGVRALPSGDIIRWRTSAEGQVCSAVVASHPAAVNEWTGTLDKVGFDELAATASTGTGERECWLENTNTSGTHKMFPSARTDARSSAVLRVFSELKAITPGTLDGSNSGASGKAARIRLLDGFTALPIADTDVYVSSSNGIVCEMAPCPRDEVSWRGKSDRQGLVSVPERFMTEHTFIETGAHSGLSSRDGQREKNGSVVLELLPYALPRAESVDVEATPYKLVEAGSGRAIANTSVRFETADHRSLDLRSNALGYVFVADEGFMFDDQLRVSVPGYRGRRIGDSHVIRLER